MQNSYASGFQIFKGNGYWVLEVSQAFPGEHQPYRYLVLESPDEPIPDGTFDATITLPVEKVVLTSTTHIPHLDLLDCTDRLVGFPNLDLISSAPTRERINKNLVKDLGAGAQSNIELMIDLEADWVMISTLGEDLKNLDLLKSAGIAAVINGEYVEQHPLGRAEWIKFTGVLLGKYEEAKAEFETIEANYSEALRLVSNVSTEQKPTVMAGVMYKDVWYVPGSDSWGAQLLNAAGGAYIFEEQKGIGSAQLDYEYVLDKAQNADFWLGASDFVTLEAMKRADRRYADFEAFQRGNVYSYTSKKGETGGIEYFELGYMRPDLILKDIVKILHPALLPEYSLYFYSKLNEK
ncbi:ABC transporter substrate-binding protein [Belliella aquatica]|uniref:ABC transporter substrate-binding protein n=1 Tax=Belliella aquatica TaxID=1323734 RepID=UPI001E2836E5|nr:ABC transporter substrate-binding protein [Belliella aquatica]MCH7407152.1 ABC transporter substrate-binding protein [Belliella aquatica]